MDPHARPPTSPDFGGRPVADPRQATSTDAPTGRRAHIYLAGSGSVGSELLRQLSMVRESWMEQFGVDARLAGLSNSRRSVTDRGGIPLGAWHEALAAAEPSSAALAETALAEAALAETALAETALAETAPADRSDLRIFVDCTADDELPAAYDRLLAAGVSVVAANKKGFAGTHDEYLARRATPFARSYLEATVGAGLPVLRSIEELRNTGDAILAAEGVLSGTLAYIFSEVMSGRRFSEAVLAARDLGYAEPDPRDDLSGQDVLRKLVILSREIGWRVEPEAVTVHPVLPGEGWNALSVDDFLARLPEVDGHFASLRKRALASGARLCFLASVEKGDASVAVREVENGHPCHSLRGTDNMVAVRTARYSSPLVIRGAGAGREVTAAGVLSDILRCTLERRGPASA